MGKRPNWDMDKYWTGQEKRKKKLEARKNNEELIWERIVSKIKLPKSEVDCWEWTACRDTNGYSRIMIKGKSEKAYRAIYERLVGRISKKMVIDHKCRNRGCVNPNHLRVLTLVENIMCGEGAGAKNARKTHCKNGHKLLGKNVRKEKLVNGNIGRRCLICQRECEKRRVRGTAKHA